MNNEEFLLGRCSTDFSSFQPKKVILIGAGAIKDSWRPLEKVILAAKDIPEINRIVYSSTKDYKSDNQMAGYLAQMVFKNHSYCLKDELLEQESDEQKKLKMKYDIVKELNESHCFTSAIESSFKNTSLIPRKDVEYIKQITPAETGIIVLNWDETIWNMDFPNILQIHGRVSIADSLIYPMETYPEKKHFNMLLGRNTDEEPFKSLGKVHEYAIKWFSSAETIISWGVGYNIYESELNSLLEYAFYNKERTSKLHQVINLNPDEATKYSISRLMNIPLDNIQSYPVKSDSD
jgi:hypothetical protein